MCLQEELTDIFEKKKPRESASNIYYCHVADDGYDESVSKRQGNPIVYDLLYSCPCCHKITSVG